MIVQSFIKLSAAVPELSFKFHREKQTLSDDVENNTAVVSASSKN